MTLAALAAFFMAPAPAQPVTILPCGNQAEMVKGLADKYQEVPAAIGLIAMAPAGDRRRHDLVFVVPSFFLFFSFGVNE